MNVLVSHPGHQETCGICDPLTLDRENSGLLGIRIDGLQNKARYKVYIRYITLPDYHIGWGIRAYMPGFAAWATFDQTTVDYSVVRELPGTTEEEWEVLLGEAVVVSGGIEVFFDDTLEDDTCCMSEANVSGVRLESSLPTATPVWLTSPPKMLPYPIPAGSAGEGCKPYAITPSGTLNADGTVTIFYTDGRRFYIEGEIGDCGRHEELAAVHLYDDSMTRVTLFETIADPYSNIYPRCAPRKNPVCNPSYTPFQCSTCDESDYCPDPRSETDCVLCGDQFSDGPGYLHTSWESAMPSAVQLSDGWHVLYTRTNHESRGCLYAPNIDREGTVDPGMCIQRTRCLIGELSGGFPQSDLSMLYEGDLLVPFCSKRGCCLGSGFHDPIIIQKPTSLDEAWVFATAALEDMPGNFRFDYVGGDLTSNYQLMNGLPAQRVVDVAWGWVDTINDYRFYALVYSGGEYRAYVYYSDDEGLNWDPYFVESAHLSYGDGIATKWGGWLRNPNGSLVEPITIIWQDKLLDHDADPTTEGSNRLLFQTDDPQRVLPSIMHDYIYWDGFEGGDFEVWTVVLE